MLLKLWEKLSDQLSCFMYESPELICWRWQWCHERRNRIVRASSIFLPQWEISRSFLPGCLTNLHERLPLESVFPFILDAVSHYCWRDMAVDWLTSHRFSINLQIVRHCLGAETCCCAYWNVLPLTPPCQDSEFSFWEMTLIEIDIFC